MDRAIMEARFKQQLRGAAELGLFTVAELSRADFIDQERRRGVVAMLDKRATRRPREGDVWQSRWPLGAPHRFVVTAVLGRRVRFQLAENSRGETELPADQFRGYFTPERKGASRC